MMITSMAIVGAMLAQGNIGCQSLTLPEHQIPAGSFGARYIEQLSVPIVLETPSNPIVDIKIGPPVGDSDIVCGDSYEASLVSGTATLVFHHGAPYYVELHHQSGAITSAMFMIDSIVGAPGDGKPPKAPAFNELIELDDHTWVVSEDNLQGAVCHGDNVTDKHGAGDGGMPAVVNAVCDSWDANGQEPVDLVLGAHGRTVGGNPVGGQVGLGGAGNPVMDKNNSRAYGSYLRGKVSSITVMSCYAGLGADGAEMLTELGQGAGVNTCGWSDCITYTKSSRWSFSPFGYQDHFKSYVNGTKFTYVAATDQTEIEPAGEGLVENRFPVQYAMPGPHPMLRLLSDWGAGDSVWDLSADGTVNILDVVEYFDCLWP